jgi:hypothetical protein
MGMQKFSREFSGILRKARFPVVTIGDYEVGKLLGGFYSILFRCDLPVELVHPLTFLDHGAKLDERVEVKLAGISLKVVSQYLMGGIICCLWVKLVEGEILVLGEGFGGDNMGSLKDTGMTFRFGIDPVAADLIISVKGHCIQTLVEKIFEGSDSRRTCTDHRYSVLHCFFWVYCCYRESGVITR